MNPVTSSAPRLLAYTGIWLIAGAALAVGVGAIGLVDWLPALLFAGPMAVCLGFVAASAYYVCRAAAGSARTLGHTSLLFGGASLVSGVLWGLLCVGWDGLGAIVLSLVNPGQHAQGVAAAGLLLALPPGGIVVLMLFGAAVYLISLLVHDIALTNELLRAAQARAALASLHARDAQLQVLRTQINPHFLFNSLNSISALTTQNAAAARAMTLELAAFFRQTLALAETDRIALHQEIALCAHFLAVEKIRFGDRLSTQIDISPAAEAVLIPPMLLQPCVENAVKHGVRHLPEGGCVALRAWVQGAWLYLTIDNPVDPEIPPDTGTGTGLTNLQRRLTALYGERARATWTQSGTRFLLEIVLPSESPPSLQPTRDAPP